MYVKLKKSRKACLMTVLSAMLMILSVSAQNSTPINVKGTVTDISGQPIIGASILLQGTSKGTFTDLETHLLHSNTL